MAQSRQHSTALQSKRYCCQLMPQASLAMCWCLALVTVNNWGWETRELCVCVRADEG